ncbi:hypothetical protein E2C01_074867 [Portunus trituberculatus]|uniref:Uncharacterized protein n=1 Tax=Portunus trituberculatus TaxID=210409 RepID=A0A5B7I6Y7_PORTR|nr:hypothetical protein [Portunus trituberculatus]
MTPRPRLTSTTSPNDTGDLSNISSWRLASQNTQRPVAHRKTSTSNTFPELRDPSCSFGTDVVR